MQSEDIWTLAFLSALGRLPLDAARDEADAALALIHTRGLSHPTQTTTPQRGWVGVTLLGWPTPEDMQRVIRPDGSDFTFQDAPPQQA